LRPNYTRDEATRYARELSSPEHADLKDTHNWFACAELMATVGFIEKQRKSDDDGLSGVDKRLIDKAKSAERQLDPPDKRGSVALGVLLLLVCAVLCALWQPREALIGWMMGVQVGGTALGTIAALALVIGVGILAGVLLDSFVAGLVALGVIFALEWALRNWAGIVLSDQMVLRGCWFVIAGALGILGVVQLKRRAAYVGWHGSIPNRVRDCGELCEKLLELAACYDTVATAARKLRNNEVYMTLYARSIKVTQQKSSGEVISEEQLSQQELVNLFNNAADYFAGKARRLVKAADELDNAAKQREG
ncbi:MAG: hypothetical protein ACI4XW_03610, partial [Candidatus Spyradocola sp.]